MRPRLEAIALEICCDKANDNELQHLANLVNDYEVVSSVDSHEFDFNVHSLIVRLAHNDYLYDAWIRVYTACSRLKYSSLSPIQDAQTMLTELREVVCHLQHRDVHAAKEAMEVHLRSFILGLGPIAASKEWLSGMK
jgi:DNA-binding FadR family transcriptional regulator